MTTVKLHISATKG